MPEFLVTCRADLDQSVIDELHARGLYLAHGGELAAPVAGLPRHRLVIDVDAETDALPAARDVVEAAGCTGGEFELEGRIAEG
jgi:hypothetical protein